MSITAACHFEKVLSGHYVPNNPTGILPAAGSLLATGMLAIRPQQCFAAG
jgi:hypothetical protein